MTTTSSPTRRFPLRRIFLIVAAVLVVAIIAFVSMPDPFINGYVKVRNIEAFERAFPEYQLEIGDLHYHAWSNRLECESVELRDVDGRFAGRLGEVSLGKVGWIDLFRGKALKSENFERSEVLVHDVWMEYPKSGYELLCRRLSVSVPDSIIFVDSLIIVPSGGDETFFARADGGRTRYIAEIPHCRVTGSDCKGLVDARIFWGRHAEIENAEIDILTRKDRAPGKAAATPMPKEVLASIKQTFEVDSVSITHSSLRYSELFSPGAAPAVITLDDFTISMGGLADIGDGRGNAVIRAEGKLMRTGRFNLVMAIPLATPEFSFRYSGSVGKLDVTRFNTYLEKAQNVRLKSGQLQEATFDIEVNSGHATGTVRAVYTDLNIAMLDAETGSEKGLKNRLTSLMANKLKIRNDNVPDKSGKLKIGRVDYHRQPGDPLFQFLWFALRSGVADVAGF